MVLHEGPFGCPSRHRRVGHPPFVSYGYGAFARTAPTLSMARRLQAGISRPRVHASVFTGIGRMKRPEFRPSRPCRKCAMAPKVPYPCAGGPTEAFAAVAENLRSFVPDGCGQAASADPGSGPHKSGQALARSEPRHAGHRPTWTTPSGPMAWNGPHVYSGPVGRTGLSGIRHADGTGRTPTSANGRRSGFLVRQPVVRVRRGHGVIHSGVGRSDRHIGTPPRVEAAPRGNRSRTRFRPKPPHQARNPPPNLRIAGWGRTDLSRVRGPGTAYVVVPDGI